MPKKDLYTNEQEKEFIEVRAAFIDALDDTKESVAPIFNNLKYHNMLKVVMEKFESLLNQDDLTEEDVQSLIIEFMDERIDELLFPETINEEGFDYDMD